MRKYFLILTFFFTTASYTQKGKADLVSIKDVFANTENPKLSGKLCPTDSIIQLYDSYRTDPRQMNHPLGDFIEIYGSAKSKDTLFVHVTEIKLKDQFEINPTVAIYLKILPNLEHEICLSFVQPEQDNRVKLALIKATVYYKSVKEMRKKGRVLLNMEYGYLENKVEKWSGILCW